MARTTVRGTNGNDRMDVRFGFNDVFGLDGDDVIQLLTTGDLGGNNFVDAGRGKDGVVNNFEGGNEILLGEGDDTYVGMGFGLGGTGDVVRGGAGKDKIVVSTLHSSYFGDSGNDAFISVGFRNTFNGGSGTDAISYEARADDAVAGRTGVEIRLDEGRAYTGASRFETLISIENARGSAKADTIVGTAGNNKLQGDGGNDLILGGDGDDKIFGGSGADELQGGNGADQLNGDSGADKLFGEGGKDILNGGSGNDFLSGGGSADILKGGTGNDILHGDSNKDRLFGEAGNDTLVGGTGDDYLRGGTGKDTLTGGSGVDKFDFNTVAEISETPTSSKRDVIKDFVVGQDKIDFSTIDANSVSSGNQAFTLRSGEQTAFTGAKGQLFWDKVGSGSTAKTIISGDTNGDKVADFQLELTGHHTLSATDFIL